MKRSRAPNFNNREIMHLLLLVEKYPIIENKKTDGATTKDKQEAWKNLAVEYNSSTFGVARTAENLIACYKNQKIKVKKQHSSEKMELKAPHTAVVAQPGSSSSHQSDDIQIILDAVEYNGFDWDLVSQKTNLSSDNCKKVFDGLVKDAKKEETDYLKEVKRTGGGPPPQPPNDAVHEKVKSLIGPSLEGLYTAYGGDFEFMTQQQALLPPEKKMHLLEKVTSPDNKPQNSVQIDALSITPICSTKANPKRLDILKCKVDPSLDVQTKNKGTKKTATSSFLELAEDKKALIKLKKQLAADQLVHQQQLHDLNMQIAKENLEFAQKRNEMELEFLRDKYVLELSNMKTK